MPAGLSLSKGNGMIVVAHPDAGEHRRSKTDEPGVLEFVGGSRFTRLQAA